MDDENNQKQLTQEEVGELSRKSGNVEYFFCVLNKKSLFSKFFIKNRAEKNISLTLKENLRFLILHFRQIVFFLHFTSM
jgi:hypothetical protein